MKRVYFSKLVILIASMLGMSQYASAQTTVYSVVGTYTYIVPFGCTAVQVDIAGAQGGTSNFSAPGGKGGRVIANIAVNPGDPLNVYVGGKGNNGTNSSTYYAGGVNGIPTGGADGGKGYYWGASGGGSTDIRTGNATALATRLVVGGGGGGGGANCQNSGEVGGDGGGLTGGGGYNCNSTTAPYLCQTGSGGTQTAAGAMATCYTGSLAVAGFGFGAPSTAYTQYGGAGGGGWYGGGMAAYGGGGGGSSYYGGSGVSLGSTTTGFQSGDGYAKITPLLPGVFSSSLTMDFGYLPVGSTSVPFYTVISGQYLSPGTGSLTVTCPSGYEISTNGSTWVDDNSGPITISYSGGTVLGAGLFVRFKPGAPTTYNNYVIVSGGGLVLPYNIPVLGTGTNNACSGTPSAGTASVLPNSGSSGTFFTLELSGVSAATGLFYQWQSSSSSTGPWADVPGGIRQSHTFLGITATTYYRCLVKCGTGTTATSSVVQATYVAGTKNATACAGTPSPGIGYVLYTPGCSPYLDNFYQVGCSQDSGITHQWQISFDGLSFGAVAGAAGTGPNLTGMVNATVYYRDLVTCKVSGLSTYGPNLQAVLNPAPDPIAGLTPICSGSAAAQIYSSTTPLGKWTSSNVGVATVDSSTGLVTGQGIVSGTATITYTVPTGCFATQNVTVNPTPVAITGPVSVCSKGATITMSDATAGGTWLSSDPSKATVSGGVVTGASGISAAGTPTISYKMPGTGCFAAQTITVYQQPAAISGSNTVCVGSGTALADADALGVWSSNNSFNASVSGGTGFVSGVSAPSTAIITYTLTGGCYVTKLMTVNSLPAAITGPASVCAGSTIALSDAAGGGWTSSGVSIAKVNNTTGVVTGVAQGSASITYTAAGTGCQISTPVTVNGLPSVFSVVGGGGFCLGGTGAKVGLAGSVSNVNYKLYKNNPITIIDSLVGTTAGLDFGLRDSGKYTITATDQATGCVNNMALSATVFINPLPNDHTFYPSASSYCVGTAGVDFKLDQSDPGTNYEIQYGPGHTVVKTVPGDGSTATDLGFFKPAGSYLAVAVNASTGCRQTMTGSPLSITIDSLPALFPVTNNGPAYCAGGLGVDINLQNTATGVSYFLVRGTTPIAGDTILSTGGLVDFGNQAVAGVYTIKGLTAANCVSAMGTVSVTVSPLPAPQPVTGGGGFCTGGPGAHVGIGYAYSGTKYYLYNASLPAPVDSAFGANSSLDFGAKNIPGVYSVVGQTGIGCTNNMTGTKTIVENTPPAAGNVLGGGGYCSGTTGSMITLTPTEPNILYRLYKQGSPATLVATKTGTLPSGSSLSFGPYTGTGTYYIIGIDAVTGCATTMTGTKDISLNALPIAFKVFAKGGGAYCANDTAKHIWISGSQLNVKYTVSLSGTPMGSVMGKGDSLDMGQYPIPGVYSVVAVDQTTLCSQNILGTANISINPLPTNTYAVTVSGTGSYCAGGTGLHVMLANSNTGINYQLYNGATKIGAPLGGLSKALDFGIQTLGGAYSIVATNIATTCKDTMVSTGTINVIPLPSAFLVSAPIPSKYCPGGTGVDVKLSNSTTGFKYRLYNGSSAVDSMDGITGGLDFGNRPTGFYTVIAIDKTYGCMKTMGGSANITNYPLPNNYKVLGTNKAYCPLDFVGGLPVSLANSDTGVTYELYTVGGSYDPAIFGTRSALGFGNKTDGTFKVRATDTTTTCSTMMADSVVIHPMVPAALNDTIFSSKNSVCKGDTVKFTSSVTAGVIINDYQWTLNGVAISGATNSTYIYTPGTITTPDAINLQVHTLGCAFPRNQTSADSMVKLAPPVVPTISASTASSTLCKGSSTTVAFSATPSGQGATPRYQWKKNGLPVGTNSTSYSTSINDSDVVFCVLESSDLCRTADFVFSNPVAMRVHDVVKPIVSVFADPGSYIEKGTPVIFSAMVAVTWDTVNTNLSYTYQWSKNGKKIDGATSGVYTSSDLATDDAISCDVTSHNTCGTATAGEQVYMTVGTLGVHGVTASVIGNVQVIPNPNKGTFAVKGTLSTTADEEVMLDVTNMLGQVVYSNKVTAHDGKIDQQVQLPGTLANGMYLLNFRTGTDHKVFHFVIEQ